MQVDPRSYLSTMLLNKKKKRTNKDPARKKKTNMI